MNFFDGAEIDQNLLAGTLIGKQTVEGMKQ